MQSCPVLDTFFLTFVFIQLLLEKRVCFLVMSSSSSLMSWLNTLTNALSPPPHPLTHPSRQKLKLDILRVQNAHAEISLVSDELRKQVERLRGLIQKLQAAESGAVQYAMPRAAGMELWQQQQDSHADILREIVGQCEARLQKYDAHIQELYRKVVPSRGGGERGGGGRDGFSR